MASQTWWPVQALADSRGVCMACLGPSADRIAGLVMGIRDPAAVVLSQAIWSTSHLNWTSPRGCLTQAGPHGAVARFAVSREAGPRQASSQLIRFVPPLVAMAAALFEQPRA